MDAKRRVQQEKIDRGDAIWTPYFTVDEPSEYGDVEYLAVSELFLKSFFYCFFEGYERSNGIG